MPTLSINGELQELAEPLNIDQLLAQLGYESMRIAIAINGDFVPRSQYLERLINDGDTIDIVQAIGGG